jgi:hypothetical protein
MNFLRCLFHLRCEFHERGCLIISFHTDKQNTLRFHVEEFVHSHLIFVLYCISASCYIPFTLNIFSFVQTEVNKQHGGHKDNTNILTEAHDIGKILA